MTLSLHTSHDHTTTTSQAAVVFIDLSGHTALTEAHGDQRAAELAEAFADLARATLGDGDRLIKTLGDAILVTSPAARTAIALLGRITTDAQRTGRFPVLRAGITYGPIVTLSDDIYGGTVNIAARLAAAAGPAQVLATEPVAEAADDAGLAVTGLGLTRLRNLSQPVDVFAIDLGVDCPCPDVDPVCRMRLHDRTTTTTLTQHGTTYRFCSHTCAHRFAATPRQFTNAVACQQGATT
ncbi:YHS domain-containing protein [Mycobacterium intracellulare]|uniref:YHS domain-containing protein n=1 Tax=Mycobacterium intracellulare TaxID=1767 RepID=UPI001CD92A79|nr:adenylate/guanylate cyclase domain-containing protein [Mycobacterium intracellulare]MCA2306053.1 YHS domain-containing protein [Mycobacterium intracellulare]MCA2348280.1 YHS domain-containing protein [Mycobacterium intracellulare]